MEANEILKTIAVLGIGCMIPIIFFEAGKGWVLGIIKATAKFISAEETVKIFNQLPDEKSSKIMTFVSRLAEKKLYKKFYKIES